MCRTISTLRPPAMPRPRPILAPLGLVIIFTSLLLGCAGSSSTKPKDAVTQDYAQMYRSGQYSGAYREAVRVSQSATGKERQKAQLIAGLSAHALNRNDDADRLLRPLVETSDVGMAGEAAAALGLVAAERGNHTEAAALLSKAANQLTADEAARAAMYAGDSYTALGKKDEASQMYGLAQRKVLNDANLRIMIGDRLAGRPITTPPRAPIGGVVRGGFSIQVGAYSNPTTAQREASRAARYGPTRTEPVVRNGKTLYIVKVGQYTTREEAERIRRSVGKDARVVAN